MVDSLLWQKKIQLATIDSHAYLKKISSEFEKVTFV